MLYAQLAANINCQTVILDDAHSFKTGNSLPDDVNSLFVWKESALIYVHTYSHNHFVKHGQRTFENIEMSCCERIERSREQCFSFHNCQFIGARPVEAR